MILKKKKSLQFMEKINRLHLIYSMFQFKRKKYQSYSDEMLVFTYKSEHEKLCLSILYERYAHLVMGVALKYLKDGAMAEDLTSHVFERLIDMLNKHEVANFKSWLYMVSKNECLMFLRKQRREVPIELETIVEQNEEKDHLLYDAQLNLLNEKIDALKDEQRKCIELFYIHEKSYNEISVELALTLNQVKSAIQNGKLNLKILLEKEDEFNQ